VTNNQLYIDVR